MIHNYIESLGDNPSPELHQTYTDLFTSVNSLNTLVQGVRKGQPLKLSVLRSTLVELISTLESSTAKSRTLPKQMQPRGISLLLNRMYKVVVELANATIYADKAERISSRDFIQSYLDSFPYQKFVDTLESHIVLTKTNDAKKTKLADTASDKKLKTLISSYGKHYQKLPTTLGTLPFKALKLPVVPLFKDLSAAIDPSGLERSGFKVTRVGDGYQVLEDQYIIAFDHAELGMRTGVRKVKGGFKVSQKNSVQRAADDQQHQDKLLDLIDKINERSHIKYALASAKLVPNPRNSKIWLAWIVSKTQRKNLEQVLRTVEIDWGLPFSLEDE